MPHRILIALALGAAAPAIAATPPKDTKPDCEYESDHIYTIDHCRAVVESRTTKPHDRAAAYAALGRAHLGVGSTFGAVDNFTKAIELDPGLARAWSGRAMAQASTRKFDAAIADYTKAFALAAPTHWDLEGRGDVYAAAGRIDEALADYRAAVKLNAYSTAKSDIDFLTGLPGSLKLVGSTWTRNQTSCMVEKLTFEGPDRLRIDRKDIIRGSARTNADFDYSDWRLTGNQLDVPFHLWSAKLHASFTRPNTMQAAIDYSTIDGQPHHEICEFSRIG